jgi:anti-sigma regulatory factor (Ser/Thr protein kinase)
MAIPFEARLPGTPLGVRRLRREMSEIAAECGMSADAIADVQLAVTEAATNAVMHAYAETAGELTVTATRQDGELAIVIGDTGPGLVDRDDSPGLGVGLSVIATVATRLRIVSAPGGTEIHMTFPCPSPAQRDTI